MIDVVLAAVAEPTTLISGIALVPLLIFAIYVFIFSLIIICLVRVSRYFRDAGKEQKLIRMDLGKLADEVQQLRQDLKENNTHKKLN
jgi:hypothetical protein